MFQNDAIRDAIQKANQQLIALVREANPAGIAALYTETATLMPPGADAITGAAAIADFWEAVLSMGVENVKLETLEVDAQSDTVIERGQYTLYVSGGQVADSGKYIVIWKRINSHWKLHWDIWNSSRPQT